MVVLATPDVTVTNESDKTTQIERLKIFSANVQKVNAGGFKLVMKIERATDRSSEGSRGGDEGWTPSWREPRYLVRDAYLGLRSSPAATIRSTT